MDPGSGAGVTVVVCIADLSIFIPGFFVIPGGFCHPGLDPISANLKTYF
jgi:hypothetical protein